MSLCMSFLYFFSINGIEVSLLEIKTHITQNSIRIWNSNCAYWRHDTWKMMKELHAKKAVEKYDHKSENCSNVLFATAANEQDSRGEVMLRGIGTKVTLS